MDSVSKANTTKWIVIPCSDGYVVARNGDDGTPEVVDHYYFENQDAEEVAEWLNKDDE